MEYGKIQTLLNRDPITYKVMENLDEVRCPEFTSLGTRYKWYITEKIHGVNTRVIYFKRERMVPVVVFAGRNKNTQLYNDLAAYLKKMFPIEKVKKAFPELDGETFSATLFGEGYGRGIQKGENYLRKQVSFKLFDVWIEDKKYPLGGEWLEPENIADIAPKLGVETVPFLGYKTLCEAIDYVKTLPVSQFSENRMYLMEGIVARTKPLLLNRKGERVMWKLKYRDFRLKNGNSQR